MEVESWEHYRARLGLPDDEPVLEFYRQVVYDHFDHFNLHYPKFSLRSYDFSLEHMSARDAYDRIKFFNNKPMEMWDKQYDWFKRENHEYMIFQRMARDLTPPFPPILIESSLLVDEGWRIYGRDLHLIEGTHRVGYLRRMLELGEIADESTHKFVVLRPAASAGEPRFSR